jgi:hypothetical protein
VLLGQLVTGNIGISEKQGHQKTDPERIIKDRRKQSEEFSILPQALPQAAGK